MHRYKILIIFLSLLTSSAALANWTLNIGYQNPGVSDLGVNFLHEWKQIAFEAGIGRLHADRIDKDKDGDKETSLAIVGDVDLKFFFGSKAFRPYLQVGTFVGTYNASAGTGDIFAGGGFFAGRKVYFYASYNLTEHYNFAQLGLGFDI